MVTSERPGAKVAQRVWSRTNAGNQITPTHSNQLPKSFFLQRCVQINAIMA